jgi:hypothetical protein
MKSSYGEETGPPIPFMIGKDTFYATREAPGTSLTDLAEATEASDNIEKLRIVMQFFDKVLLAESAALFASRLKDPNNPITLRVALEIFSDLVEEYSGDIRPTEPPAASQSGSGETGQNSAVTSPSGASTSEALI